MKIFAIVLNTFREAIRNKILYSVVLVAFLLVGVSALFGAVTMGSQVQVIKDFGLFSLSFFGAIITIVSGTTLLHREIKLKTVHNILSKPVARWQFIVGKHLGLCLTVSVLVGLLGIGLTVFTAVFEKRVDLLFLQGTMLAVMELIIIASISIFFSTLVITPTLNGMFTLGAYIAGRSVGYLSYFLKDDQSYSPVFIRMVEFFDVILPDLSLFNYNTMIVNNQAVPLAAMMHGLLYSLSYSAIVLVLAILLFQKRELV
jgi:ABC-type transport system involved in multi-copper enzyme maturation permease subunit